MDPSGYFSLKDALKIVAIVAVAYFTGGWGAKFFGNILAQGFYGTTLAGLNATTAAVLSGIGGGFAAGFSSGFAGSLLNGGSIGDAFKAGTIGGIAGAITGGILGRISTAGLNAFERGLAHGFTHGASAEATGGEFRHGFYAGFLNGALDGKIETAFQHSETLQYAAAAVVGGTGSVIGGGKFANGAVSGAFSYMFNQRGGRIFRSPRVRQLQAEWLEARRLEMEARYGIVRASGGPNAALSASGRVRTWRDVASEFLSSREGQQFQRELERILPGLRRDAIREAWRQEADMVRRTGEGTYPWTIAQKFELLTVGHISGFHGHHSTSVSANPFMAANPNNIRFVLPPTHFELHNFSWRTPTVGPLLVR